MANADDEQNPMRAAERLILYHLIHHYPAHLSAGEITRAVVDDRVTDGHATDALTELHAQGVVHDNVGYYWLTRPVAHIAEFFWTQPYVRDRTGAA
jgi:hypothetical protein